MEQQCVDQQAAVALGLRLSLQALLDLPGLVALAEVALHPGIGKPLFR